LALLCYKVFDSPCGAGFSMPGRDSSRPLCRGLPHAPRPVSAPRRLTVCNTVVLAACIRNRGQTELSTARTCISLIDAGGQGQFGLPPLLTQAASPLRRDLHETGLPRPAGRAGIAGSTRASRISTLRERAVSARPPAHAARTGVAARASGAPGAQRGGQGE